MKDDGKMDQDDSILTKSDVHAYHKADTCGDIRLILLSNCRLVSSTMVQNSKPHCTPQSLLSDRGIMGDCELNVRIRDTFDTSTFVMLLPEDDGSFTIAHLSVE